MSSGRTTRLEEIDAALTYPLRQRVLRPHQKLDEVGFDGDGAPGAFHLGAFEGQLLVGVASVVPEAPPFAISGLAWRLRGMAVAPEQRGQGVGGLLVAACVERARAAGVAVLWCQARVRAQSLYARAGFAVVSEVFELPKIGPHVTMALGLGDGARAAIVTPSRA